MRAKCVLERAKYSTKVEHRGALCAKGLHTFSAVVAAEIYKMLRTFLQQTKVTSFQDCLSQFLERLPSLSLEFSQYFRNEWLGREESWAYCYRKGMGINTNMIVEAFHRVFKYNYLKGKNNKRVDNCLFNHLKYTKTNCSND